MRKFSLNSSIAFDDTGYHGTHRYVFKVSRDSLIRRKLHDQLFFFLLSMLVLDFMMGYVECGFSKKQMRTYAWCLPSRQPTVFSELDNPCAILLLVLSHVHTSVSFLCILTTLQLMLERRCLSSRHSRSSLSMMHEAPSSCPTQSAAQSYQRYEDKQKHAKGENPSVLLPRWVKNLISFTRP